MKFNLIEIIFSWERNTIFENSISNSTTSYHVQKFSRAFGARFLQQILEKSNIVPFKTLVKIVGVWVLSETWRNSSVVTEAAVYLLDVLHPMCVISWRGNTHGFIFTPYCSFEVFDSFTHLYPSGFASNGLIMHKKRSQFSKFFFGDNPHDGAPLRVICSGPRGV